MRKRARRFWRWHGLLSQSPVSLPPTAYTCLPPLLSVPTSCSRAGIVRLFRGHVAQLLRQPYGADVITDLYDVAGTSDRNAMCSEFYGKEFVLFDGLAGEAGRLHSLQQLMAGAPAAKKRAILQHFAKALIPIMEKALVHPPITHRYAQGIGVWEEGHVALGRCMACAWRLAWPSMHRTPLRYSRLADDKDLVPTV